MVWTRWDRRQLLRAAIAALLTLAVAWLVTAATDEGGVSWGERAGRALPLTPLCAAVGAWVALAPVRSRGEALALEALGWTPQRVAVSAVMGGALVAVVAALAMAAVPAVQVGGFFPAAAHASAWTWTGSGFAEAAQGLRVGVDGVPLRTVAGPGQALAALPAHARASAALVTALAGTALPLLLAQTLVARAHALSLTLVAGVALAGCLVAFQAAAAGRAGALVAVAPAAALLAFAVRRALGARP